VLTVPRVAAQLRLPYLARETIQRIADGQTPQEIARETHYSPSAVSMVLSRSKRCLKAKTIPQLVAIALRLGIIR
jgi:DNA-binding CsgD family transcriptional regulator